MTTLHKKLVELKWRVLNNAVEANYAGICDNLMFIDRQALYDIMRNWPEHSGDRTYPVSDPDGYFSAMAMFGRTANVWVGEYGAARIRLLDFLIEETTP